MCIETQCDVMNTSMLDLIHADDREIFKRNMKIDPKDSRLSDSIGQMNSAHPNEKFGSDKFQTQYEKLGIPKEIFESEFVLEKKKFVLDLL